MIRILSIVLALLGILVSGQARGQSPVGAPRIMQGPMIGAVHPDHVLLWARVTGPFTVQAELSLDPTFNEAFRSRIANATKSNDYCATLDVTGLSPDTRYFYRVLVNGKLDRNWDQRPPESLRTAPEGPAAFRIGLGSCARFEQDREQAIWRVVDRHKPDLFLWMGDNIYGDALDGDILADEYKRQRDLASFEPVMRAVPQLAIWDDHDFGLNDYNGAHPAKDVALKVFRQYWPNDSFGTEGDPGVYFKYSYGGVDFFMLDCRYHRSANEATDGPDKTMLGKAQLAWLKDGLWKSNAAFKVLVSGSGWTAQKGPTGDSWAAFLSERDDLFETIVNDKIQGIVLLSGDTHLGELNVIKLTEKGGYDLYEFVSSPLAQIPNSKDRKLTGDEARIHPAYRLSPNVGFIDFDTTQADPVLRFTLSDIYGNDVWDPFELRASQLKRR